MPFPLSLDSQALVLTRKPDGRLPSFMKEIQLVNSTLKAKVDDEDFEAVNAHRWFLDPDTGFAFRIVNTDEGIEFMQNFIMRRVAYWN